MRFARPSSSPAWRHPPSRWGCEEPAMVTRREALLLSLFGGGFVGLRLLATGLPVAFFADPKKALARGSALNASREKAQYIVLSTSGDGDSINACVPGTYEDPR